MDWNVGHDRLSYGYLAIFKNIAALRKEFVYGGYLSAMASPLMLISIWILMDKPMDWQILVIGYLITLLVYGYDYHKGLGADSISNPERALVLEKKARLYPLALAFEALLLLAMLVVYVNRAILIFALVIGLGGAVYTIALKGLTRVVPAFKNVYTSLIWASAATFMPALQYSTGLTLFVVLIFNFIFLKCLVNVIFFDIKDIVSDGTKGLKTIPALIGKKRTVRLLYVLNVLTITPIVIGVYLGVMPMFTLSWMALPAYVAYYLHRAGRNDGDNIRHLSAIADSEFVLWPVLLFVGKAVIYFI
jgi:4-hydroxybenzoate polyprenyltransferase